MLLFGCSLRCETAETRLLSKTVEKRQTTNADYGECTCTCILKAKRQSDQYNILTHETIVCMIKEGSDLLAPLRKSVCGWKYAF